MFKLNKSSFLSIFLLAYNLHLIKSFVNIISPPATFYRYCQHEKQCIAKTQTQRINAKPKNKFFYNEENSPKKTEIKRPQNEFSRIVHVDSVLSSGMTASRKARNYSVSIEAKPEELQNLAKRFKLPEIMKLEADLTLRKDSGTKSGMSSKGELIQAEGKVTASLSQICVRTNTPFDAELSFYLFACVRTSGSRDENVNAVQSTSNFGSRKNNNRRKNRKKVSFSNAGSSIIDELSMQEIQGMLEDVDLEDDVIEDDAVYKNGDLDVGELVSQMFRLKLDPYPKKPGSKPVDITYSG